VNGQTGRILLRDVRIAPPATPAYPAGTDADVWLTLLNEGAEPDALTNVSTPSAEAVLIRWDQDCDGTATTVKELPLTPERAVNPPQSESQAAAAFDSYSLQLVHLTSEVLAGTTVDLTFDFAKAESVRLSVPVRPRQEQAEPGHLC
jgi:copper(I)-binding protein